MAQLGVASAGASGLARTTVSSPSDNPGKQKKNKRRMMEQKKCQSLDEAGAERSRHGPNPPLSRSKTVDPSFYKEREKEAVPAYRQNSESRLSNLMKHAINFHRVFKDLPLEEELLETFSCAWQQEITYHGRLYISHHHVCFYCSMIRREVKVTIPVTTISILKKANTALLVPNAVCIRTSEGEKFVFASLRSRESVYQLLRAVCTHLQDGTRNSRLTLPDNTSENLSKVSQDPGANSQLSEHEIFPEESELGDEADTGAKVLTDLHLQQHPTARGTGAPAVPKPPETWTDHMEPISIIILIYLFLVVVLILSSGYIGLRIVQLEEQLTSMGAWPDLHLQPRFKET
uniref:GRAM domain-containing protein 2A-like isoform X2 n=1 Tax=Pogona vitticeps TaxID=103695 RepID=A0ABM5EM35_9SAUR